MAETYQYRAWDRRGRAVRGSIEVADGTDPERIAWRLRVQGLYVTWLEPAGEKPSFFSLSLTPREAKPMKAKQLAVFSRQLAIMLSTGLSVVEALRILAAQQPKPARLVIEGITRRLTAGEGLTAAFRKSGRLFPRTFVEMLEVGEQSGNLPEVLERLSLFYEREAKLRGDLKQALTYPTVVIGFAFIVTGVILFFILPLFAEMFAEFGAELPAITRVVLGIRDSIARYYLIIVPSLIAGTWGLSKWIKSEKGRTLLDGLFLRLPIVSGILTRVIFARFSRTLGLLTASGVSMVDALRSCERVVGNRVVAKDVATARDQLQQGRGLAEPLRSAKTFPPMLVEMIHVGEETGEADKVLRQISDFYEQEVEQAVKSLTSIVEPVVIVLIGLVVAIVLVSVFLPMFQLGAVIQ